MKEKFYFPYYRTERVLIYLNSWPEEDRPTPENIGELVMKAKQTLIKRGCDPDGINLGCQEYAPENHTPGSQILIVQGSRPQTQEESDIQEAIEAKEERKEEREERRKLKELKEKYENPK